VYEATEQWRRVDGYFQDTLVGEDAALVLARESCRAAGMPDHEVAPNQGALLALLARMCRARRVLEIGTLGGYSTIWLARAAEHVTTLEATPTAPAWPVATSSAPASQPGWTSSSVRRWTRSPT
jgi:predicted O-methyltransferase YrrM